MEETIKNAGTEVPNSPVEKKLSYEELENVAHQLSEQARSLYTRVQQLETNAAFQRLTFLFKVIDRNAIAAFSTDFVEKCAKEIEEIMTLPEEEVSEDKE